MNFKLDIGIWYLLTNPLVDEMIYGSQNKLCKVWVITRCQNNSQATIAKVEKLTRLGRHLAGGQPLQCDNSPGGTKAFLCWDTHPGPSPMHGYHHPHLTRNNQTNAPHNQCSLFKTLGGSPSHHNFPLQFAVYVRSDM